MQLLWHISLTSHFNNKKASWMISATQNQLRTSFGRRGSFAPPLSTWFANSFTLLLFQNQYQDRKLFLGAWNAPCVPLFPPDLPDLLGNYRWGPRPVALRWKWRRLQEHCASEHGQYQHWQHRPGIHKLFSRKFAFQNFADLPVPCPEIKFVWK